MAVGRDLGRAILRIVADISGLKTGLKQAQASLKSFATRANEISQALTSVASTATRLAVTLAAVFTPIISQAAKFEETMSAVKAVTIDSMRAVTGEFGTVEEQFASANKVARDLGQATTFTATQVAEGMKFLGQAGLTMNEVVKVIPNTLTLARAGLLDLGKTSDIVTDIMSAFNIKAEDTGRIMDVLAEGARSSNTTIEQMGDAFKFLAPVASAFGQSIEEMSAGLAVLARRGLRSAIAGTGISRSMAALARGGNKQVEILAKYGLTLEEVNPATHAFSDIVEKLAVVGLEAGDAMQLFGQRAGRTFVALQDGVVELTAFKLKMDSAKGAAAEMSAIMQDNVRAHLLELTSKIQEVGLAIFDSMAPAFDELIEKLKATVDRILEFIEKNKELVGQIAMIGIKTGGAAAGLAIVATALSGVTKVAGSLALVIKPIIGLLTGPLGIIVALTALGAYLGVFEGSLNAFKQIMKSTFEFGKMIFDHMAKSWQIAWTSIIKPSWEALKTAVGALIQEFANLLDSVFGATDMWKFFSDVLVGGVAFGLKIVLAAVEVLVQGLRLAVGVIQETVDWIDWAGASLGLWADKATRAAAAQQTAGNAAQQAAQKFNLNKDALDDTSLRMQDYAGKLGKMIAIQEKGKAATENEMLEFAELKDALDALGLSVEDAVEKEKDHIKALEDEKAQLEIMAAAGINVKDSLSEVNLAIERQKAVLASLSESLARKIALDEKGIEPALQNAAAAREEVAARREEAKALNEGAAAREALNESLEELAKIREKIREDRLEGFEKEIDGLRKRAEEEKALVTEAIQNSKKTLETDEVLFERKERNLKKILDQLKEYRAKAKLPFQQEQLDEKILDIEAKIQANRDEFAEKRKAQIMEENELLKAQAEIEQGIIDRKKKLLDEEREKRREFARDVLIDEKRRIEDFAAAAELERQKALEEMKKKLDEMFDLRKAANAAERAQMIQQRKDIEKIRRAQIDADFIEAANEGLEAEKKDKNAPRQQRANLEAKIETQLLGQARTLRDIFLIERAIMQLKINQERRAVLAAKRTIELRREAEDAEKKAAFAPGNKRLQEKAELARLQADAAAAIQAKRLEEANLGGFGPQNGVVAQQQANAIKQIWANLRASIRAEIQFMSQESLKSVETFLDRLAAMFRAKLRVINQEVAAGMGNIKQNFDPARRASPSLNDYLEFTVRNVQAMSQSVQRSLQSLAANQSISKTVAGGGGMSSLSTALQTGMTGLSNTLAGGLNANRLSTNLPLVKSSKAGSMGRSVKHTNRLTMTVNNNLDSSEVVRHVAKTFRRTSQSKGAI